VTAAWSANPIAPALSASAVTLTLTASAQAAQGSFSFVVTAEGDGLSAAQSVTVQVQAPHACFGSLLPLRSPCIPRLPARMRLPQASL
jgi:hypothetical protein